jgi:hypothetical protein
MEYVDIFNDEYIAIAKKSVIYPRFKIEILDDYENAIMEITQDISADSSGTISVNYQQGVRRSCSITIIDKDGIFIPKSENGLFWINRKFKLYVGLDNKRNIIEDIPLLYDDNQTNEVLYSDNADDLLLARQGVSTETDTYWFSQGVFYITNPSTVRDFSNQKVTINGIDKFGILTSELGYNQLTGTYVISAGTNIYNAIKDILILDKGNGTVLDPISPILDSLFVNEVLPYDINKSPGSYLGEILIEIAKILGCDIFYDVNGVLNLVSGTIDISYSQKSSIWEYDDILPEYSGASLNHNFVNAINVVKVVSDNINGELFEFTAENNNPTSPTRIEVIGRKELALINSSFAYDQQTAENYATYVLNIKSIVQVQINFDSSLIPHIDVNQVVGVTDNYFNYIQQRFIIQSLDIPLSTSGLMNISASNIADLPYFET